MQTFSTFYGNVKKKKKKKITQRYNTKELFLEKALKDTDLSDFKMIWEWFTAYKEVFSL